MKAKLFDATKATIDMLKNKELSKCFARDKSLEDYYQERAIEELSKSDELEAKLTFLQQQLDVMKEKFDQKSKPLEQRVEELEENVKQIRNGLRATRKIVNMWEPMK